MTRTLALVALAFALLAPSTARAERPTPDRSLPAPVHGKHEVRVSLHEIGVKSIKWIHCNYPKGRLDAFCGVGYAYPTNQKPWVSCTIIRNCDPARMMADGITFRAHCREHMHVSYSTEFMDGLIELGPGMHWGEDYWTITESMDSPRCWMHYQS